MSMRKLVDTGAARIEVLLRGDEGPLAVMIPAGGRGAADFETLAAALAKAGWRTAAINRRPNPRSASMSLRGNSSTRHRLSSSRASCVESLAR